MVAVEIACSHPDSTNHNKVNTMSGRHALSLGSLAPDCHERPCHAAAQPSAIISIHRLDQKVDGHSESLFIAFLHGSFAGSAVAKIMDWNGCSIRALFVASRDRRAGVATRLLAEIEKWAIAQKADQLECAVIKSNDPARQFWIRRGRFIDDPERTADGERAAEYVVMTRGL